MAANSDAAATGTSSRQMLIATVEAVGGVRPNPDGTYSPLGDTDWIDLADAYLTACHECGREPMIVALEQNDLEVACG